MGASESMLKNQMENLQINCEKEIKEELEEAEGLGYEVIVREESEKPFEILDFTEKEDQVRINNEEENQSKTEATNKTEDEDKTEEAAFAIYGSQKVKSSPNKQVLLYWHARMCTKPRTVETWKCLVPNCSIMKLFLNHIKHCISPTQCVVPLCGIMKTYFDNADLDLHSHDSYPYFTVSDGSYTNMPAEWRQQQIKYFSETVLAFSNSKAEEHVVEYLNIYAAMTEADVYREAKTKENYYGELSYHISKMIATLKNN